MIAPRKWVIAVALSVLGCGIGACSGSAPQPGSTSTVTATASEAPTTSGSPSPPAATSTASATTAPEIPADARAATADGAQKFAAYWISQFNQAFRAADATPIRLISTAECTACQGFISDIEKLRQSEEHVNGDIWTVIGSDIESFDNVASAVAIVSIKQNPVSRVGTGGSVGLPYKERNDGLAFSLQHNGSQWVVTKLQVVQ